MLVLKFYAKQEFFFNFFVIFFFPPEGPERRSAQIDKKNKIITAYHESGHAIVAYYTKDAMPINKATIMPRGPSLGHVRVPQTLL